MRRSLVVGNWKMHGLKASVNDLITDLKQQIPSTCVEVAVCPPFVFLDLVQQGLSNSNIVLGAQTLSEYSQGAFTGEIAADMLVDCGCRFVIIGHSERRTVLGESDQVVAAKFIAAQQAGLTPILCVGESLEQREKGETLSCIEQQLLAVIDVAGVDALQQAVVAYEPIWAIGTGKTASPEQAQEVHAHIRHTVAIKNAAVADSLQILYGGSVKADNAAELFAKKDIDGALVGGAALKAAEFAAICKAAA